LELLVGAGVAEVTRVVLDEAVQEQEVMVSMTVLWIVMVVAASTFCWTGEGVGVTKVKPVPEEIHLAPLG